jgi:hypothetical protein
VARVEGSTASAVRLPEFNVAPRDVERSVRAQRGFASRDVSTLGAPDGIVKRIDRRRRRVAAALAACLADADAQGRAWEPMRSAPSWTVVAVAPRSHPHDAHPTRMFVPARKLEPARPGQRPVHARASGTAMPAPAAPSPGPGFSWHQA